MSYPEKNALPQQIAREAISEMHGIIRVGMSEKEIADTICEIMTNKGSQYWWYHGVGALVFLGKRTRLSMSAREYIPDPDNRVAENDIITIDCSPTVDRYWGDYTRTIFIEDGIVAPEDRPSQEANLGGLNAELAIHRVLVEECDPGMTYEEIFYKLNGKIRDLGFVNLDYHGNLGHSIEFDEWDRYYLEKGSTKTVREVGKPFTLEPHIALPEKGHGFKRENIYYIDGNSFKCL
ncbi:MAG: aminopeptidase P family protein [Oscillospiraceae bacterium]|nr:aminopeptidase P family protein [Oscillospiraceae bacterium]